MKYKAKTWRVSGKVEIDDTGVYREVHIKVKSKTPINAYEAKKIAMKIELPKIHSMNPRIVKLTEMIAHSRQHKKVKYSK